MNGLILSASNSRGSHLPNNLGYRERLVLSFLLVCGYIEVTCQRERRSGAMQISREEKTMPPRNRSILALLKSICKLCEHFLRFEG